MQMHTMPSETRAVFEALQDEVIWLHAKFNIHRQLFGTSEERINLLNDFGPDLFQIIYDGLLHDVFLTLTRLTDPATTFKKHNLSLERLTKMIEASGHSELLPVLQKYQSRSDKQCEPFRQLRNQAIAHNDLGTALTFDRDPFPFISREMIEEVLKDIREYMTAVDMYFDETETDYKDPHLRGDGDSLIYYLRKAKAYDENRGAGRLDPSRDGLI